MNLTNLADIRALLARHDFRFSKSLGQNFLTAAWVPADIADASGADARTGGRWATSTPGACARCTAPNVHPVFQL